MTSKMVKMPPILKKNSLFSALRYPSGTVTYQLFLFSVAGDEEMVDRGLGPRGPLKSPLGLKNGRNGSKIEKYLLFLL